MEFIFYNTNYKAELKVDVGKLKNEYKFRLIFSDFTLNQEICEVSFINVKALMAFIINTHNLMQKWQDTMYDDNLLYEDNINAYGEMTTIHGYYISPYNTKDNVCPSEDDDTIMLYISKGNVFLKHYSILLSIRINEYFIDQFMNYILLCLEHLGFNVPMLLHHAHQDALYEHLK